MVDGSKEAQTVPFLVILRVLVAYVKFYFRLQVSCKVDFEERTYVALSLRYSEAVSRCSVKKNVLRNFAKFTGKHMYQRLFFNKVAGLFLRTPFFIEHLRWLLLDIREFFY